VRIGGRACRRIATGRMERMSKLLSLSVMRFGIQLMEIGVVRTRSTAPMTSTSALGERRHKPFVWGTGGRILRMRGRHEEFGQARVQKMA
jgi:hypothetical protein